MHYSLDVYEEYAAILESENVEVDDSLKEQYEKYMERETQGVPYADTAILRIYTAVFFLQIVKKRCNKTVAHKILNQMGVRHKILAKAMTSIKVCPEEGQEKEEAKAREVNVKPERKKKKETLGPESPLEIKAEVKVEEGKSTARADAVLRPRRRSIKPQKKTKCPVLYSVAQGPWAPQIP